MTNTIDDVNPSSTVLIEMNADIVGLHLPVTIPLVNEHLLARLLRKSQILTLNTKVK